MALMKMGISILRAAAAVAEPAEQRSAERTHQELRREDPASGDQPRPPVLRGKEDRPDDAGERTVGRKK
jgi:hypothetical protein